jgi:KUP system potassium uptake protein
LLAILRQTSNSPLTSDSFFSKILTPAVSVVTAVGGIAVAKPAIINSVVGISVAFLVPLFLVQSFGTRNIGFTFAPITAGWLLLLGVTGAINISHYPGVFRAFDPSRAVMFFVRSGNYDALSGVVLAVTGSEG